MKKSLINIALAVAFGSAALSAQAATLYNGDVLSINTGVNAYDANGTFTNVSSGSWFAMDTNGNAKIAGTEKVALSQGSTGLVIGPYPDYWIMGASHAGIPVPGDINGITAPWSFFGNTGSDYLSSPVTGSTETGLNLSGWTVTWNGVAAIPMGSGTWGTGYSNGIGNLVWNGIYGSNYTLDYHGSVPLGDASGFGGVKYALHLEGAMQCQMTVEGDCMNHPALIPVPAAAWLLGSGLLGLVGVTRRRKQGV